ncbi:MAG: hypothetical protein PUA52_06920 [Lachnospiraceae bacterium]|nr:hypothetical protein [Lachnospiraceae bacterium]
MLKLLLYLLSCFGYVECLRRWTKVSVYYLPGLTIALQTSLLFLAGLCGQLARMTYLLFFVGLLGLGYGCVRAIQNRNAAFLGGYLDSGYISFAVIIAVMAVFVRGKVFTHYDNFNHWAVIIRTMLTYDRFPNAADTLIRYRTYPPGSAVYLYYFGRLVSEGEAWLMLAQIIMMTAAILPLFSLAKRHKPVIAVLVIGLTHFFFTYNVLVNNLLVDTLLPLVGMSALLYLWEYGRTIRSWPALFLSAVYLIQIVLIKNSGLFFAAAAVVCLIIGARRDHRYAARLPVVVLPLLSNRLWSLHCAHTFADASSSAHTMSLDYYASVLSQKSGADILQISRLFLKTLITDKSLWFLAGMFVAVGALIGFLNRRALPLWKKTALAAGLLAAGYEIGLLGMYLFSMPLEEAVNLASYGRYSRSLIIALVYLLMVPVIKAVADDGFSLPKAWAVSAVILLMTGGLSLVTFGTVRYITQPSLYHDPTSEKRYWLDRVIADYQVPAGSTYCVLKKYPSVYYRNLGRYLYQTTAFDDALIENEEQLDELEARYLFVEDGENPVIQAWIEKNYPDQAGREVIICDER